MLELVQHLGNFDALAAEVYREDGHRDAGCLLVLVVDFLCSVEYRIEDFLCLVSGLVVVLSREPDEVLFAAV
jgi:hypothetical protein